MIEQTLEQWRKEGKKKFGEDISNWKFVCPACKKISSVGDFEKLGAEVDDAYQNCIGRFNGKGKPPSGDNPDGCDWASYGLLGTCGKGRLIKHSNDRVTAVFDFAEEKKGD